MEHPAIFLGAGLMLGCLVGLILRFDIWNSLWAGVAGAALLVGVFLAITSRPLTADELRGVAENESQCVVDRLRTLSKDMSQIITRRTLIQTREFCQTVAAADEQRKALQQP